MKALIPVVTIFLFIIVSCNKIDADNPRTIKKLYKDYEQGMFSECMHNGERVYSASKNAYDAATVIYDKDYNKVGICNYAWGPVDDICSELTECEIIYCVEDNIWGYKAVDKYGVAK